MRGYVASDHLNCPQYLTHFNIIKISILLHKSDFFGVLYPISVPDSKAI